MQIFYYKFENGAVQRIVNLVDLEKIILKNAPTLAIVAVRTDENEPPKVYESPSKISVQNTAARPSAIGALLVVVVYPIAARRAKVAPRVRARL